MDCATPNKAHKVSRAKLGQVIIITVIIIILIITLTEQDKSL